MGVTGNAHVSMNYGGHEGKAVFCTHQATGDGYESRNLDWGATINNQRQQSAPFTDALPC